MVGLLRSLNFVSFVQWKVFIVNYGDGVEVLRDKIFEYHYRLVTVKSLWMTYLPGLS